MWRCGGCALVVLVTALLGCGDEAVDTDPTTGSSGGGGISGAGGSGGGGLEGPLTLTFIDDFNIPTGTMVAGVEMGGLSGLSIDTESGHAWAICDDQAQFGPPRFYELDISVTADEVLVTPLSHTVFETGATPAAEMDAEGIVRVASGDLYVSTEGDTTPIVAPTILHLDASGSLVAELSVDTKYVPNAIQTEGVRRNLGFEALTLSPSGGTLFTATEGTIQQDGPAATFSEGQHTRILRYDMATGAPAGEFFYLSDPIPAALPGVLGDAGIGVPEMLALSDDRLLVLERSGVQVDGVYRNTIRVYEVSVVGALDVGMLTPLPTDAVPLDKRLVLDLDSIVPELEATYPKLDNFEAMSFGPSLADGRRTLVLLSDNNFGPTQRTAFFAFAIE